MTARRGVFGILATAALLLLLGRWCAALYTDSLWFASLGAIEVWRARLVTTAILEVGSFLVAATFAFGNLYAVRRSVISLVLPRRIGNIEIGEEVSGRYLIYVILALAVSVGLVMLLPTERWSEALLAVIGRPFGESDPYMGADLGFYVYWIPFETTLHVWATLLFALVTSLVVLLYALTPSLRWDLGRLYVSPYVRRHIIVLGGVLLLLLAWGYRLDGYALLAAGSGADGAFTVVDQRVLLPVMLLLAVISLCAAIVVAWAGWTGQTRLAFIAVSVVLLVSIGGRIFAPLIAQRMTDPADAAVQGRAYQGTRLGYTRRAFGVDRMVPETLTTGFASAQQAAPAVAIWDGTMLVNASERLRRVQVVGSGAAWQAADGTLTALLVEHSSEGIADVEDVWGVRRLDPTTADEHGMPLRDPAPSSEDLVLAEPAVYDSAPAYSVLSDSLKQLAGVEMVSTLSRLAHAWSLQNFRLLFGTLPLNRPTIVRHRDVRDRLNELAPFFVQGSEVLPLLANDSLYWVVELYTASNDYPLAQRFTLLGGERGYLQHAGTALIHAASGRVSLIPIASPDAVTQSWMARFPTLFQSEHTVPQAALAALPPAADAAKAQALAFAAAGFRGDSLEVRHFGDPDGADSAGSREPLHVLLPGIGVSTLTPLLDGEDRVRGVIAAVGGRERGTSWIPLVSDELRWGRVVDRMRGADTTMREPALVHGPVRVLPVAGQPFYLQSVFQWHPGGSPALLDVVILRADTVRSGSTLAAALGSTTMPDSAGRHEHDRATMETLYRAMRTSLARGDWVGFGQAFDSLGATLRTRAR